MKQTKGFTLPEILIAISILVISIVSVYAILQSSIHASGRAKDRFISSYIAQENIELVKHQRNTNILQLKDWSMWLDTGAYIIKNNGAGVSMQAITADIDAMPSEGKLCITNGHLEAIGFVGASSCSEELPYYSFVLIEDIDADSKRITGVVNRNKSKHAVSTIITNWKN